MVRTNNKKLADSNKSLFVAMLLFLVLLVIYFAGLEAPQFFGVKNQTATMIISFNGQQQRSFWGPVMDDMTVLEAFVASTNGGNIEAVYNLDSHNTFSLASISEYKTLPDRSWNFYVNHNQVKTEDINKIQVQDGDLLEVKYH